MKDYTKKLPKRFLKEVAIAVGALVLIAISVSFLSPYEITKEYSLESSTTEYSEAVSEARVTSISEDSISVFFEDSPHKGTSAIVPVLDETARSDLSVGDAVLISYSSADQGYFLYGFYRIPLLIILVCAFIAIVILVGRRKGIMSIAGLGTSILIIGWVIIPLILAGHSALFASVLGACLIAIASIGIAHGFNRRTYLAIASVLLILLGITVLAHFVIAALNFTGMVDETTYYLQRDNPTINLTGILTGGIIIAALGALDDIVTTQVAVVDQLKKTDPSLTSRQLFSRASSVGSEHIIALVNTLALVYAGAALPLLVTYATQSSSPLAFFNSEFIATEIARTIIVSIGLVLSVPLSTWIAARYIQRPAKRRQLQKSPL